MIIKNKFCSLLCRSLKLSKFPALFPVLLVFASAAWGQPAGGGSAPANTPDVPILLYHRFGPTVADSMTITTSAFESHLKYLRDNGYKVIPLRRLTDWYLKRGPAPAPKSVVIVEDDAHVSVYRHMLPIAKKYNVPVTVFVYPSAISNARYAMTWEQLRELKKTGLFDIQSHTYWHANFKQDRKKMKFPEFEKSVDFQLRKSKEKIERELGGKVDLLAWPFGIHDDFLIRKATDAGYRAAFTIVRRHAGPGDAPMRLPRYLMTSTDQGTKFAMILGDKPRPGIHTAKKVCRRVTETQKQRF